MENNKFGSLSSSVNPQELSTTIVGIIKVLIGVSASFGIVNTIDGNTVIEQVAVLVPIIFTAWGSMETLFGLGRKVVVKLQAKYNW